jgi:hypothetical protein
MQFAETSLDDLLKSNQAAAVVESTTPVVTEEVKPQLGSEEGDLDSLLGDSLNSTDPKFSLQKEVLDEFFNSEKLIPFVNDKDEIIYPSTVKEFESLIESNKEHWAKYKATISPAMKFVLEQSSNFRTPDELIPLLQSVSNQDYLSNLSLDEESDQELIVRKGLEIQGLPVNAIDDEIEYLKDNNRLYSRAEALKPLTEQHQLQVTNAILKEKQVALENQKVFWSNYYESFEKDFYNVPNIEGIKLKTEDKNRIASLILPSQEMGGVPLYNLIDKLIENRDVVTLSKIALLSEDPKLFDTYYGAAKSDKVAESLQLKLRSSISASSSQEAAPQEPQKKQTPRYGFYNR